MELYLKCRERKPYDTFPGGLYDNLISLHKKMPVILEERLTIPPSFSSYPSFASVPPLYKTNSIYKLKFTSRYFVLYRGEDVELDCYSRDYQQFYTNDISDLIVSNPPDPYSSSFPSSKPKTWLEIEIIDSETGEIHNRCYENYVLEYSKSKKLPIL
jgi:hypothetical protein